MRSTFTFADFKKKFQEHFAEMTEYADRLYEVDVDKDELWDLYLDSFPADANRIFRKRREFDCSCCRQFIRAFGNVVTIINGAVISVWDFRMDDAVYQPVLDALSAYIHSKKITDVYYANQQKIGADMTFEWAVFDDGRRDVSIRWDHFHVVIPSRFLVRSEYSEGDYKNIHRTNRNVFKRSLDEISMDAIDTVIELINSNSLYRGAEWLGALEAFRNEKATYDALNLEESKELFAWQRSANGGSGICRIRNHSIGVLLTDITEGMDLDTAVRRYEKIVAPQNYKRPKAIFTQRMLEEAQKKVVELGYMDSLPRRFATMNDITVNNILFCNRDAAKTISGGNVFADMAKDADKKPLNFDRVQEIGIDDFIKNVLPTTTDLEVYFENRHSKNMMSLIAPQNADAKSMLKWNNNFGWSYAGNVTDSLKENVMAAGGKVDGDLRFSIQWNDGEDWNKNDFDAHCEFAPEYSPIRGGRHIYYNAKFDSLTRGELDVDIRYPMEGKAAVENITWPKKEYMKPGEYKFYVNNYAHNGGRSGFKAEIEFDGKIYEFNYPKEIPQGRYVRVADVQLNKQGEFAIKTYIEPCYSSREIWNLKTCDFVPVSMMMYSPNYWDEQQGIGHKHVFFMLKDCLNPETPNGFYNEFLKNELMEHKRVFEALGGRMKVEQTDNQLSGVGFSTTKRDHVIVRVTGATKRVMKVMF